MVAGEAHILLSPLHPSPPDRIAGVAVLTEPSGHLEPAER
jgi:hypothetical protein